MVNFAAVSARMNLIKELGVQIWNKKLRVTPPSAKYCGRPGPWGNPFEIGPDGNRDEVCDKFELWLDTGYNSNAPQPQTSAVNGC